MLNFTAWVETLNKIFDNHQILSSFKSSADVKSRRAELFINALLDHLDKLEQLDANTSADDIADQIVKANQAISVDEQLYRVEMITALLEDYK